MKTKSLTTENESCSHPTLRLGSLDIAEGCPGCRRYVVRTGASFARVENAVEAAHSVAGADVK